MSQRTSPVILHAPVTSVALFSLARLHVSGRYSGLRHHLQWHSMRVQVLVPAVPLPIWVSCWPVEKLQKMVLAVHLRDLDRFPGFSRPYAEAVALSSCSPLWNMFTCVKQQCLLLEFQDFITHLALCFLSCAFPNVHS